MTDHTLEVTTQALLDFMKSHQIEGELQAETGQPYFIHRSKAGEFPVFFRIYDQATQLQILTFFPLQVRKNRYDTLARVLLTLNNDIDMPGFGLDERMGLVFHRIMIPVFDNQVPKKLIELYLSAIPSLCDHFGQVVKVAIESDLSTSELLKRK